MQSDLSEADREAIRQVHEAWLAAELRGDAAGVLALCTDDVHWLVPNSPVLEGREAGRRLLLAAGVQVEAITATDVRVEGSGMVAYKTSHYETRYRATGSSEVQVARGTHLWVLRRVEGRWHVALVTWQAEGADR